MRRTIIGATLVVVLVGACSTGGGTASPGAASPAESTAASPAESMEASPSAAAGGDASAWAQGISGDAVLSGWQASPEEGKALQDTLGAFATTYPNVKVDYKEIPGDYRTV